MKIPYVFNIQKFSVHDGPGIRTTIFFKGCPIRCIWCHNPESQNFSCEMMETKEGKQEIVGNQYAIADLVKEVSKDQIFYDESGGGVTLSGGEVMVQDLEYIIQLAKDLQRIGVSVAIDTCGVAPFENFDRILPYVDLFLYDLKFINSQKHKLYTGVSNKLVIDNLKRLSQKGASLYLRLIMIEKINTSDQDIYGILNWLNEEEIQIEQINLLPYHEFGQDKYRRLSRKSPEVFQKPSDSRMEEIKEIFRKENYKVKIGG